RPGMSWRVVVLLAAVALAACATASGSAVVTGTPRHATSPDAVRLYSEPPPSFEVIGLVQASSESGSTEQESSGYAVEEPKRQAAKLGANGVLLTAFGTRAGTEIGTVSSTRGGFGTYVGSASLVQTVAGKAIVVTGR